MRAEGRVTGYFHPFVVGPRPMSSSFENELRVASHESKAIFHTPGELPHTLASRLCEKGCLESTVLPEAGQRNRSAV